MEVSPDDLKLPQAVITRLIKEALPEGVIVSKEAKTAIARAAAIFVLHATTFASENAQAKKCKNITADDIMYAIKSLECDELETPVREALEAFRQQKKTAAASPKKTKSIEKGNTTEPMQTDDNTGEQQPEQVEEHDVEPLIDNC